MKRHERNRKQIKKRRGEAENPWNGVRCYEVDDRIVQAKIAARVPDKIQDGWPSVGPAALITFVCANTAPHNCTDKAAEGSYVVCRPVSSGLCAGSFSADE